MHNDTTHSDKTQQGFALVSTIWISGLLTVATLAFLALASSQSLWTRNRLDLVSVQMAADGMAELIAYRAAATSDVNRMAMTRCAWSPSIMVDAAIQDQGGLIDINTASPELILALLRGLTESQTQASRLQALMLDFRDADSISQNGSSEPQTYPGLTFGPKNAPFETVLELDQIPGLSPSLFQSLQLLTTVHSQQQGFDASRAPAKLIAVLTDSGMTEAQRSNFNTPSPLRIFRVDALARSKNGAAYWRSALIDLTRQPEKPFVILSWQRLNQIDTAAPLIIGENLPACFSE